MRTRSQHRAARRRAALFALAIAAAALPAAPAVATGVVHGAIVEDTPRRNTPQFVDNEVRAGLQVGNRIIVGGDFTQVIDDTHGLVSQGYLAAYDLTTGRLDMNFRPVLDGRVHSIADAGNGTIIAVGKFSSVNGLARKRVVKLRVVDGSVVTAFTANASATVNDVAVGNGKVFIGGNFITVNGISRASLAAVDLTTGDVDSGFDLPISAATGMNGAGSVRAVDVTPDGNTLLSLHNSTFIDGLRRQGVALIDVSGPTATVKTWQTDHYDYDCQPWFESFKAPLMRDAQFSPDGSYFVVVSAIGNYAPGCDVAVRFPTAGGAGVTATWVSRMFDTPEAVAVTDQAIYVGGHMRWLQAPGTVWTQWTNGNTNDQPDDTVVRDQIGALDPADGTALPWDPSATGQRGVLALRVTDAGLLAGSDGEWFGGRQTFRHALFELPEGTPPEDNANPTTTIAEPLDNVGITSNQISLSGTAADDVGVVDVRVTIRNNDTGEYLEVDGSFGPDWVEHETFVPDSGDATSDWRWTATLPDGSYRLRARAADVVGKVDGSPAEVNFVVQGAGDLADPDGDLDVPKKQQVFAASAVAFSGTVTDDIGVDWAKLAIKNTATGEYLRNNGTFGPSFRRVDATLAAPGTLSTSWAWNGTLPDGPYSVKAHVGDLAGNTDPTKAFARFLVTTVTDNQSPDGVLDVPTKDQVFTSVPVEFSGSASDNVAVARVRIVVRDLTTLDYLQDDGSFGPSFNKVKASLGTFGHPTTTWSWTGTVPDGDFRIRVFVQDGAGNADPTKATTVFTVAT